MLAAVAAVVREALLLRAVPTVATVTNRPR